MSLATPGFPAESTQQNLGGLFGYFKNNPSLKSFQKTEAAGKVCFELKLKREENEKDQNLSRGGQLNRRELR